MTDSNHDPFGNITKKNQVNVMVFGGRLGHQKIFNWLVSLDDYLEWYELQLSNSSVLKMKLMGHPEKMVKEC